ncbi:MAG: response regulator transcription factor [Cytophagales bacterium]|nr:response regulator transcription factor [Cytophagales bacterium]
MSNPTTILVIDDHPLVADGIKTMLKESEDLKIIGVCKTAKEALSFLMEQTPDIILLDISLPDMDGLQLCEVIRKKNKESKIIGLTSTNEAGIITGLLQRGGNGYLLKNMEREDLIEAIATVTTGKIYLSKAANERVLEQFHRLGSTETNPVLTRREKEILKLLSDGLNGPEIAENLFLSPLTVETHRKNLLRKFNAHSVQLLLKIARDNNLL